MPKTAVPKRPGPQPSARYVTSRNALLAAALSVNIPTLDVLAQEVGIYRENMSRIANGRMPVSARVEEKLRGLLPDVDKWLS